MILVDSVARYLSRSSFLVWFALCASAAYASTGDTITGPCIDAIVQQRSDIQRDKISIHTRKPSVGSLKFRWDSDSSWIPCNRTTSPRGGGPLGLDRFSEDISGRYLLQCGKARILYHSGSTQISIYDTAGDDYKTKALFFNLVEQNGKKCAFVSLNDKVIDRKNVIRAWQVLRVKYQILESTRSFWIEIPTETILLYPRIPVFWF